MSWRKITLEDICSSIVDGDHQPPPKTDNGIPFVTISNITNTNKLDFTDTMFVSQEYYDNMNDKRRAHTGDILYSVVGSFGIPVFIDKEQKFVFQRHIAILRPDPKKIVPRFLYYIMLSRDFYMKADTVALGAAQRTISLTALRKMEIEVPTYNVQEKIVKILEPFDDLIENNQKQIKLLEEAAQRLYKEWFVDLRFPGYEKMKVIVGVPEGWKKRKVTDFLEVKYGKDHKALEDGDIPAYGSGGVIRKVKSILYSGESILIPRKGSLNNIMYVTGDFWTIDTMFFSKPRMDNILKYTYLFLKRLDMYSFNIGAAVPSMTVKILDGIDILQPDEKTLVEFEKIMNPMFSKIGILATQIKKMQQTRDGLLPKLINGEIEV